MKILTTGTLALILGFLVWCGALSLQSASGADKPEIKVPTRTLDHSLRHIYIISAQSGEVIIYSTVLGGVTNEVLGSLVCLYWCDANGVYHQHYASDRQIVHISDKPIMVKGISVNVEITKKPEYPYQEVSAILKGK